MSPSPSPSSVITAYKKWTNPVRRQWARIVPRHLTGLPAREHGKLGVCGYYQQAPVWIAGPFYPLCKATESISVLCCLPHSEFSIKDNCADCRQKSLNPKRTPGCWQDPDCQYWCSSKLDSLQNLSLGSQNIFAFPNLEIRL